MDGVRAVQPRSTLKPLRPLTCRERLPIERAIEVVEAVLERAEESSWYQLRAIVEEEAPEAMTMLSHVLKVLLHAGCLRRRSDGPDRLCYVKTHAWRDRDLTLGPLRGPRYRYRFRPRSKAALAEKAARRVLEAHCPTLASREQTA